MNADFRRKGYEKRNAIEPMFWGLKDFRRGVPKSARTLVLVVILPIYHHRLTRTRAADDSENVTGFGA
jgi:hypothetical protein